MKIPKICRIIPSPCWPIVYHRYTDTDTFRSPGHNNGLHLKLFGIGARSAVHKPKSPIPPTEIQKSPNTPPRPKCFSNITRWLWIFLSGHIMGGILWLERYTSTSFQSDKEGGKCNKYAGHWQSVGHGTTQPTNCQIPKWNPHLFWLFAQQLSSWISSRFPALAPVHLAGGKPVLGYLKMLNPGQEWFLVSISGNR